MNNNNKQIVKSFECNVCVFVVCCVDDFLFLFFIMAIGKYAALLLNNDFDTEKNIQPESLHLYHRKLFFSLLH